MRATTQDGSYPRPMMCRDEWASLNGDWDFAHDDADQGLVGRWYARPEPDPFLGTITVPYPPESPASGIGERGFHPVVWYRRQVHVEPPAVGEEDRRTLIHFGAVDYRSRVWLDGHLVATHVGGQTPFTADITDAISADAGEHFLVVRAEDDPADLEQPRGKQDWRETPHGIWYERTTGIWQTVWIETVPADHVVNVAWDPDVSDRSVRGWITLSKNPAPAMQLDLKIMLGDEVLARKTVAVQHKTTNVNMGIAALRNGQDRARLLWSPEHPALLDIEVVLRDQETGRIIDTIASYVGLRTVSVGGGSFKLNDQPYYVRAVLNQGYRQQTHLAARGTTELRTEVELTKAMGFNTARVHQKAEDPVFLYWADRLGLMVWAETAAAYEFSPTAVELLVAEWTELVRRDRSHPAIVVWVPVNESWGVQDIAGDRAQQHYALGLTSLTRALDPGRLVVSNEGWEHLDSDIVGLHDYTTDPEQLHARYSGNRFVREMTLSAHGPAGRRSILTEAQLRAFHAGDAPLMITEFGGISMSNEKRAWGYGHVGSDSEYASVLLRLFDALRTSTEIVGFCYTQFMDTAQETNGLLFKDGTPKLPIESIHQIVTGVKDGAATAPSSTFGWTG